jgi:DNA repair protein RadC
MIKDIAKDERPYEKCLHHGAVSLNNAELLAVLLRTGTKGCSSLELAHQILSTRQGDGGLINLHQITLKQLKKIKGIGTVKAIQILCICELAKRLSKASASRNLKLNHPSTIADYFMEEMRHETQEIIKILMLDSKSKLIGESNISKGSVNASFITPRELFIEALEKEAVGIILLHNHPSGDPTPSKDDVIFTKRVSQAGEMLGIPLLDHIIIGNKCHFSFKNEKLI